MALAAETLVLAAGVRVLTYGGRTKELCGGEAAPTTNNRMELMAAIQALES